MLALNILIPTLNYRSLRNNRIPSSTLVWYLLFISEVRGLYSRSPTAVKRIPGPRHDSCGPFGRLGRPY